MTKSRNNSVVAAVTVDAEQINTMAEVTDLPRGHDLKDLTREAAAAVDAEHSMGLIEGIKTYPYAVGWSVLISTCIVMEGFDTALLSNLYALAPFAQKYGTYDAADGTYQISAPWQSGLSNAALVGEITGLWANGIFADKFGYRKTIVGSLLCVAAFVFLPFFAVNLPMLCAGEVLLGIPWGVFQTITTTYAAEVCPVALRAYLTTYVNLCWVFGQLIASGALKGVSGLSGQWAYRVPFALQWIWPIPLAIAISFAPDSPWWWIRKEQPEQAKKALLRLTNGAADPNFNVDDTIAMMVHTNLLEKVHNSGTSYLDCFKNTDLRRTEIASMVWVIQTMCGSTFMGYSTYFFEQAGLSSSNSFSMTLGLYAIGAVGTMSSWFLMTKFGRRSLYLSGQIVMLVDLLIIGFLGIISKSNTSAQWAIGALLLFFTFTYDATVGPVCYSLVAEVSSNRLRAKTVVLARIFYNITGLITNILTPRMLNPTAWDWGAKSGFFWAGSISICIIWTFFRLPEPKGRTFGELDVLFEQGVPARKFATTVVDQFGTTEHEALGEKHDTRQVEYTK